MPSLDFRLVGSGEGKGLRCWYNCTVEGVAGRIGQVLWSSALDQYCFCPSGDVSLTAPMLACIREFLVKQNESVKPE